MLTKLPAAEYAITLKSKRRGGMEIHRHYGACMHLLVSRWAAKVTPHQLVILMFVLDRTFYHSKLSETIVFDQFLHGMARTDRDEMVFCGVNMSKNTLAIQLKSLVDDDFLHAYACIGRDGKTETQARLFAINCKKLFNLDIADEENPMILREPKAKRVVQHDDFDAAPAQKAAVGGLKTPRHTRSTPSKNSPPNLGAIYTDNDTTKVVYVGGAAPAEPQQKIDPLERVAALRKQREEARAARTAKRPTSTGMRALKADRSNPYSKANVQALLDTAMRTHLPTMPRVIATDKPLGVLKKRMAVAGVALDEFIDWAIKFWMTTAAQHERAARKRSSDAGSGKYAHKPLPTAPDFNALCYQAPYFLACYRSFLVADAAGLATTREQQLEQKVQKLERAVAVVRDEARSAQTRERNLRRTMRAAPPAEEAPARPARITRTARPVAATHVLDDDMNLPSWDEIQAKRKAVR